MGSPSKLSPWSLCLILACSSCSASPPRHHPADAAAREWLALLDARRYGETWTEGSEQLRLGVSQEGWARALKGVHAESGAFEHRELHAIREMNRVRNLLEPGEFVIVQYESQYQKLPGVETLVLHHEGDDWRVSGYRVEPKMPWD
ncbi:MAG: DUF4019 domain-containing protein [Polyangiaceae bacterium]